MPWMTRNWEQWVFEVASVYFKADDRQNLPNTPLSVVIGSCHRCFGSWCENFDSPMKDCISALVRVSPQNKSIGLRSGDRGGRALEPCRLVHVPLNTSLPTTAVHLPRSAVELRSTETTTSNSKLQTAPAEQSEINHDMVEQSACPWLFQPRC
jgi:hypothetical protein